MGRALWNLYFWVCYLLLTVVGLVLLPLLAPVWMLVARRPLRVVLRRSIAVYGRIITRRIPFLAPVTATVAGELPKVAVYVANHNSSIDPYLFSVLHREMGFVTSWPFRIPVYGWLMRLAGYADARQGWEAVEATCRKMLADDCAVLIWPEGHRSRDGSLGRFRNGAFSLAVAHGIPVVPVCTFGARSVLAPGEHLMHCGRVHLEVLPPMMPGDEEEHLAVQNLRRRVRRAMEEQLRRGGHFN